MTVRRRGWTGGEQRSEKGGGEWTRQGDWVAEGLISTTRMTSILCTLCNKNELDLSYLLHLQIEGKDLPVTTSSYLSPSSGAFVFVALNQQGQPWQQGDDKDSSNAMVTAMAMEGSSQLREVGGGGLIIPSGNQKEEEPCCGHACQLACTVP
jgi:hypothetical protein